MAKQKTIEVWDDTMSNPTPCRDDRCGAPLIWYEIVKSGKRMCFESTAVPLVTKTDEQTGRLIAVMDFEDNHWRSCPGASGFKR